MTSKIITVAAYKGGVGKTRTAYELAYLLGAPLVDFDYDGGGASGLWGYDHGRYTRAPLLDAFLTDRIPRPLSGGGTKPDLVPTHPNITTLSRTALREEITRNDTFLRTTYGVTGLPFFRPPYGHHNPTTDQVAADLGYPTIAMWNGSLADSSIITEEFLLGLARQWFQPQHIVIGHANHPAVTHVYPQLLEIITQRRLQTVTLADVYATPR